MPGVSCQDAISDCRLQKGKGERLVGGAGEEERTQGCLWIVVSALRSRLAGEWGAEDVQHDAFVVA
eukprot:15060247-Heterocapsa_arctica.AAC.1